MMVNLGKHIKLVGGGTPSKDNDSYWNGDIPWASVKDFKSDYMETTQDFITQNGVDNSSTRVISKGTLLIATRMAVGKVSIPKIDVAINQDLKAIYCDDNILPKFLFYVLKSKSEYFDSIATGATVKGIKINHITDLQIPLPPLSQQKKIAEILDATDALRQNDKALIAKYDELTQALFLDMFGDPVSNPKGWENIKLGLVTNMKAGKFIAASEIYSENDKDLFSCYGGNGLRGFVKSYTHTGNFVLIGRQGALCGNVKVARGKFHATEHAIVCSPKMEYKTLWFYYLLDMINLNRYATGAAQPGLNVGKLVELEIIFAPYDLQTQFAERVVLIEEQKAIAQKSLEKSEELFNSLLQKAFKVEL